MPWETWTTTLDVAIALADDAGLQLAVDEGDVVRDLVLESTALRVLEYAGNRYELFDPVLDFVGHDAPALRVLVVYFFPAVTLEPADLEVLDNVNPTVADERPKDVERVPDLGVLVPAVVDDDVQLAADLLGPALEDGEVALVARDL